MGRHVLAAAISILLLFFATTSMALAQDITGFEGFRTGEVSLYGYILNYLHLTEDNIGNVLYFRLKGDWNPGANLSFHMELSNDYRTGNQHPDYLLTLLGAPAGETDSRDSADLTLKIDHLWGLANLGNWDIQFGKIPIGWGTGYAFNPTAKTHPVSFLDDISEETPGTLGILSGYSISNSTALQAYLAFEDKTRTLRPEAGGWDLIPFGVKVQKIRGAFDFSLSWIREVVYLQEAKEYDQEYYLGGDFVGAVGDFSVYGELALNLPRNEDGKFDFSGRRTKDLLEYCVGGDYIFSGKDVTLRMEYYHQGRGETNKANYNLLKGISAGQELQAEDYLLVSLERIFLDYYQLVIGSLINLNDGSLVFMPELTYDAADNLELILGSAIPYGEGGSEFNGIWEVNGNKVDLLQPFIYLQVKLSF